MAAEPDFAGTERFALVRHLGRGATGIVFEALDRERDRRVALKLLGKSEGAGLHRFRNEFRSLCDLHHPNLVELHELHAHEGHWFITMELVEGVSLLEHVRPAGALDEARLRAALIQLTDALKRIHGAGKVHRDVKPSNVLVQADGRVVLLDFGLVAARADDAPGAGTAAYMPPEVDVTPAADWYAVGTMIFEALTGELPFTGHPLEVLARKRREAAPRPSSRNPSTPADLDELTGRMLRRTPHLRPDAETILGALAARPRGADVRPALFVGRSSELDLLGRALADVRAGRMRALLFSGDSGVGKSELARRFVENLAPQCLAFTGRCYEREAVPYKGLDAVIDDAVRFLAALPPADATQLLPEDVGLAVYAFPALERVARRAPAPEVEAQDMRARIFQAVGELIARIARARELVVFIDDLHLADADSLALLRTILVRRPPILFIGTARTPPEPLVLPETDRVHVGGLADADASELARLLGADDAGAVVREAAGHPMYIAELARAPAVLGGLEAALRARVDEQPLPARQILRVLAVAGGPISQEAARVAAGLDGIGFDSGVTRLRAAKLVRTGGGRRQDSIEPYHERVRVATAADLSPTARASRHRRLAEALDTVGGSDPETLAVSWAAAGEPVRAVPHFIAAARQAAAATAFERAARLYRRALELGGEGGLHVELGEALASAGRGVDAAAAFLAAADSLPDRRHELERRAGAELLRAGHIDEGLDTLDRALRPAGMAIPRSPRRALLSLVVGRARLRLRGLHAGAGASLKPVDASWPVAVGLGLVDTVRGAAFQTQHLLAALRAGEPVRLARALALEACYSACGGSRNHARTADLLSRADALARRAGDPHAVGLVVGMRGVAAFLEGRYRQALAACEEAEILLGACVGAQWETAHVRNHQLLALTYMGEMRGMRERATAILGEASERGDRYAATATAVGVLPFCCLATGEPDEGRRHVTEAIPRWSHQGWHVQHYSALMAHVQTDLYEGQGRRALDRIVAEWPSARRSLLLRVQFVRIELLRLRARAALAVGEKEADAAEKDARRILRERAAWSTPMAQLLLAGAAGVRGDREAAATHATGAEIGFRDADMLLMAAVSRRRVGEMRGDRALVDEADAWMTAQEIADPPKMTAVLAPGFTI